MEHSEQNLEASVQRSEQEDERLAKGGTADKKITGLDSYFFGMPIFYEFNNFCTSSIVGGFSGNGKREIAIAEHALAKRTIWSSEKPFKSP